MKKNQTKTYYMDNSLICSYKYFLVIILSCVSLSTDGLNIKTFIGLLNYNKCT